MVFISVVLDFFQEYKAGKAAEKLKQSVALRVTTLRNNKKEEILTSKLVPGDIVFLEAGDLVPADGYIIQAEDFFVNQSILTGETFPVQKDPKALDTKNTTLESAKNAVFMGTSVVSGYAKVLVCKTANKTILGNISDILKTEPPPSSFHTSTKNFGYFIMRLTILLVFFVLIVNLFLHRSWLESLLFALALAVGMTPEFMTVSISIALAQSALRMAKKKVIVKRLAAIHDLGSMDVLCTDKTGTLTQAQVKIERYITYNGKENERILTLSFLNSFFQSGVKNPLDKAILQHQKFEIQGYKKISEIPFDSKRRLSSVSLLKNKLYLSIVKGAPENILDLCKKYYFKPNQRRSLTETIRKKIDLKFKELSSKGLRVLAVAEAINPSFKSKDFNNLTFVGFITFYDPPKRNAGAALHKLLEKGISIKIISGDNEYVTMHLCNMLSIPVSGVLIGSDIDKMEDYALSNKVEKTNIFCRVTPSQKTRILTMLKHNGHTVGFMGDGVNDAPALHMADVGISVDGAVDVAREAADFILLERNLEVIDEGVLEGRRTFENIMKYIMMMMSSNLGNMFSMAAATILLPFIPMAPPQVLLNNLLYDFSQVAVPFDNVDKESLQKPKKWDVRFIRNFMLLLAPVSSIFDFITFYILLGIYHASKELFQTGWFIESLATQVLVIFIIRTRLSPLKSKPHPFLIFTSSLIICAGVLIPFMFFGKYFGFVNPPIDFLFIILLIVLAYLPLAELAKNWFFSKASPS
jgi:Mg2+-importing ATPase